MARAVHIWVIEDAKEGLASAVFTVKREMVSYLKKMTPGQRAGLAVQKFKDGGHRLEFIGTAEDVVNMKASKK